MKQKRIGRREMLRHSAFAGIGAWITNGAMFAAGNSPNDKLNTAFVGIGHRGRANLMTIGNHEKVNCVALCDVDTKRAGDSYSKFPWAKKYSDFRVMLDEMHKSIDAVVVSTPDHTHAVAAVKAMKMGKHCYCEKPLAHCIFEARAMAECASENKLVTQIGTQHHAKKSTHELVEIVQSGVIGTVRECHVWIGGNRGGGDRPTETPPVPEHLNWDLWLGPRPYRPYHPVYVPYGWRFWWNFGTGETGNNGVHIMDFPFWALKLRHPVATEAEGPPVHPETSPTWMHVRHTFPSREDLPPLTLDFYHTKKGPKVLSEHKLPHWDSGVLFVGSKGLLLGTYSKWKLYPESKFAGFKLPESTIPDSVGHHREWVDACRTGGPTTCSFAYSGPLTELVLLGNVAYRTGEKITWDAKNCKAVNCPKAEQLIHEPYRRPWKI